MARPGGAIAAALEAAAVASPRGSKSFARLVATISLRSCPRGQARSGQDGKGAGNIGRWCGSRWPADRLVRSSQGLPCDHWLEWKLGASPVDWVCRTAPAGARAEVRPGSQTSRFRSRRRDEDATKGLLVDERAQARARIEDQQCR